MARVSGLTEHALEYSRQDHLCKHVQRHYNWESQKVQNECIAQASEVAIYSARFRLGYCCFCGSEETREYNEERSSHPFADGEWGKLVLMNKKIITSEHERKKGGEIGTFL